MRKALAYCTDRRSLAQAVYPYLTNTQADALLLDGIIPPSHWAYSAPSVTYPFSPTLGQGLLQAAGWTLAPGATYRTNALGYELAVKVSTTTASFRQTLMAALEAQLRDYCGIRLVREHMPGAAFFANDSGLQRRDFELAVFAWIASGDPGGLTLYGCEFIPTQANGWLGQNYSGWCSPGIQDALHTADNRALPRLARQPAYAQVQEQLAQDKIGMYLMARVQLAASDANLSGFDLNPSEQIYTWNASQWSIPATTTIRIGSVSEPATLWGPADLGPGQLVWELFHGRGYTNLNYDYQAALFQSFPSLENGGVITQNVTVLPGETVVDALSNVAPLAPGMFLRTPENEIILYAGGPISLTRVTVSAAYKAGLKWSDGSSFVQADLALWDQVNCELGLSACNYVASRQYPSATSASYMLYPGYLPDNVTYFLPGAYPSQRTLSDGRKLNQAPAAEWASLPEVNETPYGLGPFRLLSWVKGQKIVLEPNPHYPYGAPLASRIEFIYNSSNLEASLLSGAIDLITPLDLFALSNALQIAQGGGLVDLYTGPSITLEHLDFNLDLYTRVAAKIISPSGGVITSGLGMELEFPTGVFTQPTDVLFNEIAVLSNEPAKFTPIRTFSLLADAGGGPLTTSSQPYTITVSYSDAELVAAGVGGANLSLAYWTGSDWQMLLPCAGCGVDPLNHTLTAVLNHFGEFALAAWKNAYLPVMKK